jgi:hypothetical protein
MNTLDVWYSCSGCGLVDTVVNVPCRVDGDDVGQWMKDVGVFLSEDHAQKSPNCHPKTLQDVKIPITGAPFIGAPVSPPNLEAP